MANKDNLNQLLMNVEREFTDQGIKKDVDPRTQKESFNLIKQPNGLWFKSTKEGLHTPSAVSDLDFNSMPALLELTKRIDEKDEEIRKFGGRIFITHDSVYKIVKGTSTPLFFDEANERSGKYLKVCEEIISQGFEKDRFRVEETYLLSRTARGEWSITSSHDNHSGKTSVLNLKDMPQLKIIADKLSRVDLKFKTNGGRVFITPTRIYRLQNKIEMDYKI